MHNILSLIVEAKKKRVEVLKKNREEILSFVKQAPALVSFKQAIQRQGKISIIGEIKQASPSAGVLRKDFSHLEIARMYLAENINAVSVITEEEFFLGKLSYLTEIKKEIDLPVLRKDFILDEIQVFESRAAGADAILLIMSILDEKKFQALYNVAKELGMDVLTEVHTERELRKALKFGVDILGVNNRSLHTFKVDIKTTQKLVPFIPADVVKISESGIHSLKDMLFLKGLGVDAVLIGEAFMRAADIREKMKEMHIDV